MAKRSGGWIYILSNRSMPGILKIGMTTRAVEDRIKELSGSTSSAMAFELVTKLRVNDPLAVERAVHQRLNSMRVNKKREFFRADIESVDAVLKKLVDENGGLKRQFLPNISILQNWYFGDLSLVNVLKVVFNYLTRFVLRGLFGIRSRRRGRRS